MIHLAPLTLPTLICALLLQGCGGAQSSKPAHKASETPPPQSADSIQHPNEPLQRASSEAPDSPMTEAGEIRRTALNRLLEKGPAHLLTLVTTEPHRERGTFVGFKIVSFQSDTPHQLDLRKGDIVTAVNGLAIIKPDDYFRVFQNLNIATSIRIDIIRDNQKKTIILPIIE